MSKPAAFINAIAEEGTKAEAVEWLQKTWDENCDLRTEIESLKEQLATCRELREYDRGTIKEQLAKIIELFKQLGVR